MVRRCIIQKATENRIFAENTINLNMLHISYAQYMPLPLLRCKCKHRHCIKITQKVFRCYEQSILEIWDFDRDIIFNLTQADILDAINTLTVRWATQFNASDFWWFLTNWSESLKEKCAPNIPSVFTDPTAFSQPLVLVTKKLHGRPGGYWKKCHWTCCRSQSHMGSDSGGGRHLQFPMLSDI